MLGRLFLVFTVVPLVELGLLLKIGELLGVWTTIGIVVGTGAVGAWLARLAGLRTLDRIRQQLASGAIPTNELIDGALILASGAMLVTPGVLTDVAALSLLTPPGRAVVRDYLKRRFKRSLDNGTITIDVPPNP